MKCSPHAAVAGPAGGHRVRRNKLFVLGCCLILSLLAAASSRPYAQSAAASSAASSTSASAAAQPQHSSTANAEEDPHSRQITAECADLLKLATDLKAQVDKSTKDQLSVKVVRDAGQIEQLARKVKSASPKD